MVTIDLETGQIIKGSFTQRDENEPEFREDGIDYVLDGEVTFPRSETPDFLYEVVPGIDELSQFKITVKDSLKKIWLSEIHEGELTMAIFTPLSSKTAGGSSGPEVDTHQEALKKIAKDLRTYHRQEPKRSTMISEPDHLRNLNHLLNRQN